MKNRSWEQFQSIFFQVCLCLLLSFFTFSPEILASQDAVVVAEKAMIYSDQQMSSTVGFVKKGKRIKIGDIARNQSRVFPIIVSGKVAYIKADDVSTDTEDPNAKALVFERYKKQTQLGYKTKYSLSYISYATQISLNKGNPDGLEDKNSFNWMGVSLKGEAYLASLLDLQILVNYLSGTAENEAFRMLEAGVGGGFRVVNFSRFKVSADLQILGIPYASYSYTSKFRVNGYGFTAGAGGTAVFRIGEYWGVEGSAGIYYTRLSGFQPPKQFEAISPGFYGSRIYVGVNYQF
jgi:hypothetical protein